MIDQFIEHGAAAFLFPIMMTWCIGLIPPLLIRFIISKKQLSKKISILLSIVFFFVNIILFISLGSETKVHSALAFIGLISYIIFRYRRKTLEEKIEEKIKKKLIAKKQKENAKDWSNNG